MCPIITPDFSEAQETGGTIPPGLYKARIVEAEQKTSKNGNPYLNWKMQIFGAEGDLAKYNNWPFYYMTMTSGRAAGNLRDLCQAALGEVPAPLDTDLLLGKEVVVALTQELDQEGNPSKWPRVKSVRKIQH